MTIAIPVCIGKARQSPLKAYVDALSRLRWKHFVVRAERLGQRDVLAVRMVLQTVLL